MNESPEAWILIISIGLVLAVLLSVGGLYFIRFYKILVLKDYGSSSTDYPKTGSDHHTSSIINDSTKTGTFNRTYEQSSILRQPEVHFDGTMLKDPVSHTVTTDHAAVSGQESETRWGCKATSLQGLPVQKSRNEIRKGEKMVMAQQEKSQDKKFGRFLQSPI